MPKIIPARADQDYISRVHGVAASQTIVEGDPVKIAAGLISKAASADTAIYGFAAHSITTDASGNTVPSYTSGSYAAPADGFSAPDRGLLVYVAQAVSGSRANCSPPWATARSPRSRRRSASSRKAASPRSTPRRPTSRSRSSRSVVPTTV